MTVRDWISSRTAQAPPALTHEILAALGSEADEEESRTAEVCIAAAVRSLEGLLTGSRFGRAHALELLGIDALTTFGFEHASQSDPTGAQLAALARQSAAMLGQLTTQRV